MERPKRRSAVRVDYVRLNDGYTEDEPVDFRLLFDKLLKYETLTFQVAEEIAAGNFTSEWYAQTGAAKPMIVLSDFQLTNSAMKLFGSGNNDLEVLAGYAGLDREVQTLEVASQSPGPRWTLRQWCAYWRERSSGGGAEAGYEGGGSKFRYGGTAAASRDPLSRVNGGSSDSDMDEADSAFVHKGDVDQFMEASAVRKGIHPANRHRLLMMSAPCSGSKLAAQLALPNTLTQVDLLSLLGLSDLRSQHASAHYLLSAPANAVSNFTLCAGGCGTWLYVLRGEVMAFALPPTPENLGMYLTWVGRGYRERGELLLEACTGLVRLTANAGQALSLPAGWLVAFIFPDDTLAMGAQFLTQHSLDAHLSAAEVEEQLLSAGVIQARQRFPGLPQALWHAAVHYARLLRSAAGLPALRKVRMTSSREAGAITGARTAEPSGIEESVTRRAAHPPTHVTSRPPAQMTVEAPQTSEPAPAPAPKRLKLMMGSKKLGSASLLTSEKVTSKLESHIASTYNEPKVDKDEPSAARPRRSSAPTSVLTAAMARRNAAEGEGTTGITPSKAVHSAKKQRTGGHTPRQIENVTNGPSAVAASGRPRRAAAAGVKSLLAAMKADEENNSGSAPEGAAPPEIPTRRSPRPLPPAHLLNSPTGSQALPSPPILKGLRLKLRTGHLSTGGWGQTAGRSNKRSGSRARSARISPCPSGNESTRDPVVAERSEQGGERFSGSCESSGCDVSRQAPAAARTHRRKLCSSSLDGNSSSGMLSDASGGGRGTSAGTDSASSSGHRSSARPPLPPASPSLRGHTEAEGSKPEPPQQPRTLPRLKIRLGGAFRLSPHRSASTVPLGQKEGPEPMTRVVQVEMLLVEQPIKEEQTLVGPSTEDMPMRKDGEPVIEQPVNVEQTHVEPSTDAKAMQDDKKLPAIKLSAKLTETPIEPEMGETAAQQGEILPAVEDLVKEDQTGMELGLGIRTMKQDGDAPASERAMQQDGELPVAEKPFTMKHIAVEPSIDGTATRQDVKVSAGEQVWAEEASIGQDTSQIGVKQDGGTGLRTNEVTVLAGKLKADGTVPSSHLCEDMQGTVGLQAQGDRSGHPDTGCKDLQDVAGRLDDLHMAGTPLVPHNASEGPVTEGKEGEKEGPLPPFSRQFPNTQDGGYPGTCTSLRDLSCLVSSLDVATQRNGHDGSSNVEKERANLGRIPYDEKPSNTGKDDAQMEQQRSAEEPTKGEQAGLSVCGSAKFMYKELSTDRTPLDENDLLVVQQERVCTSREAAEKPSCSKQIEMSIHGKVAMQGDGLDRGVEHTIGSAKTTHLAGHEAQQQRMDVETRLACVSGRDPDKAMQQLTAETSMRLVRECVDGLFSHGGSSQHDDMQPASSLLMANHHDAHSHQTMAQIPMKESEVDKSGGARIMGDILPSRTQPETSGRGQDPKQGEQCSSVGPKAFALAFHSALLPSLDLNLPAQNSTLAALVQETTSVASEPSLQMASRGSAGFSLFETQPPLLTEQARSYVPLSLLPATGSHLQPLSTRNALPFSLHPLLTASTSCGLPSSTSLFLTPSTVPSGEACLQSFVESDSQSVDALRLTGSSLYGSDSGRSMMRDLRPASTQPPLALLSLDRAQTAFHAVEKDSLTSTQQQQETSSPGPRPSLFQVRDSAPSEPLALNLAGCALLGTGVGGMTQELPSGTADQAATCILNSSNPSPLKYRQALHNSAQPDMGVGMDTLSVLGLDQSLTSLVPTKASNAEIVRPTAPSVPRSPSLHAEATIAPLSVTDALHQLAASLRPSPRFGTQGQAVEPPHAASSTPVPTASGMINVKIDAVHQQQLGSMRPSPSFGTLGEAVELPGTASNTPVPNASDMVNVRSDPVHQQQVGSMCPSPSFASKDQEEAAGPPGSASNTPVPSASGMTNQRSDVEGHQRATKRQRTGETEEGGNLEAPGKAQSKAKDIAVPRAQAVKLKAPKPAVLRNMTDNAPSAAALAIPLVALGSNRARNTPPAPKSSTITSAPRTVLRVPREALPSSGVNAAVDERGVSVVNTDKVEGEKSSHVDKDLTARPSDQVTIAQSRFGRGLASMSPPALFATPSPKPLVANVATESAKQSGILKAESSCPAPCKGIEATSVAVDELIDAQQVFREKTICPLPKEEIKSELGSGKPELQPIEHIDKQNLNSDELKEESIDRLFAASPPLSQTPSVHDEGKLQIESSAPYPIKQEDEQKASLLPASAATNEIPNAGARHALAAASALRTTEFASPQVSASAMPPPPPSHRAGPLMSVTPGLPDIGTAVRLLTPVTPPPLSLSPGEAASLPRLAATLRAWLVRSPYPDDVPFSVRDPLYLLEQLDEALEALSEQVASLAGRPSQRKIEPAPVSALPAGWKAAQLAATGSAGDASGGVGLGRRRGGRFGGDALTHDHTAENDTLEETGETDPRLTDAGEFPVPPLPRKGGTSGVAGASRGHHSSRPAGHTGRAATLKRKLGL